MRLKENFKFFWDIFRYESGLKKRPKTTWIQTFTHWFDVYRPDPKCVRLVDIARSLSNQCRYNGHVTKFYSVAEHSVLLSEAVGERFAYHALVHDFGETYISDIARPIKLFLFQFLRLEKIVDEVIFNICGISGIPKTVKDADFRILIDESEQLMNPCSREWGFGDKTRLGVICEGWVPDEAMINLLDRFVRLASHNSILFEHEEFFYGVQDYIPCHVESIDLPGVGTRFVVYHESEREVA